VTIDQCETWFQNDFNSAQANAKADVPCFDQLNEARQAVLIDMAYELGRGGLAAFHNFIRALTMCAWSEAALQMKASKWATQVPEREAEDATIMLTGEFPC
jgi:lysozyme